MTISRTGCSWLFLGTLLTVAVGCDVDGSVTPSEVDPPAPPVSVRLVPAMATYAVGERVAAEVRIGDAANVGAVAFRLQYDRTVLEYVAGVEGTFMNSDGSHTLFLATPGAGDEIVVGLSRLGGSQGASGSGLLLTVEFLAVGAGDAGFAFADGVVEDPRGQHLPAVFRNAPVLVVPGRTAGKLDDGGRRSTARSSGPCLPRRVGAR